jgi:hypothetical protein
VWCCEKNDFQCVIKVEMNGEINMCGFVRRTIFNVWQRLKWGRRDICVISRKECFSIVCDKGLSEWREKSVWFCDKNISLYVTKDKMSKEINLLDFVKWTFLNLWWRLKQTKRFQKCASSWSAIKRVWQLWKLYFGNMDTIRKVCKLVFGTMEGAKRVQQFWKFTKVNLSAHQFDCILEL